MNGIIASMKSKNIVDLVLSGSYKEAVITYLAWVKNPDLDLNYKAYKKSALVIAKHLILDCNNSQPWTKEKVYQDFIKYEYLTVSEFNDKYGRSTYGVNRYKIAEESDINTFVCMIHKYDVIPYFCNWIQAATAEELEAKIKDTKYTYVNFCHIIEG